MDNNIELAWGCNYTSTMSRTSGANTCHHLYNKERHASPEHPTVTDRDPNREVTADEDGKRPRNSLEPAGIITTTPESTGTLIRTTEATSNDFSIGDIRGTWKHLGSKREWKMLFRRAKHQSGVRERRATPAPEESKAGATSCTEVIHPLQAQLLVDDFHYAERPMAATSLTRAGCRATSGATSSTRARFGEVKHVFRSDLWERPSAPAPRFILCRKLMKEPNFQYNNYQQKSYSNNQQGGYQQRQNTQQGNYQPRQNTPPGFNNTNNQSTQAQGSSSQAPASDTSVDA
ncbi:hypothetical protein IGI04_013390, partial [Brassica rapa subsp. trilocularis]